MTARPARVIPCDGGIRVGLFLRVSFQRFAPPSGGVVDDVPRSLGALPVGAAGDGTLLLPVGEGEAFWIGLSTEAPGTRAEVAVAATLADGSVRAEPPVRVVGASRIPGMARADGRHDVFSRTATASSAGCRVLALRCRIGRRGGRVPARPAAVTVRLVDAASFAAETGCAPPGPLDPEAAYGGWRLP